MVLKTKKSVSKHFKNTRGAIKASNKSLTVSSSNGIEYCGVCRDKVKVSNITFVDLKGKNGAIRKRMVYMCEKHGHKWGKFIAGTQKSDKSLMNGGAQNPLKLQASQYAVPDTHKNSYFIFKSNYVDSDDTIALGFSIDLTIVTHEKTNAKTETVNTITFYLKLPPKARIPKSSIFIIELFSCISDKKIRHDLYYITSDNVEYTKTKEKNDVFCEIDISVDSNIGKFIKENYTDDTFTLCAQIITQAELLGLPLPEEEITKTIPGPDYAVVKKNIKDYATSSRIHVTKLDNIVFIKAQEADFIKSVVLPPQK